MQDTQSNASKVSSKLALAINEEVVEAKVSFLALLSTLLNNGLFFNSYSILDLTMFIYRLVQMSVFMIFFQIKLTRLDNINSDS